MPDKPCEVCGGTFLHAPDCARRDVVATRAEADAGLNSILARQMASDPEFVRRTEDGWQAIEAGRCRTLDEVKQRLGDAPGWDKPKVDHWLGRVGGHIRVARFVSLLISGDALPRSAPGQDLLDEWLRFSLWEQVYALYGLRDLVAAELTADIHHWQNLARTDDDARSK